MEWALNYSATTSSAGLKHFRKETAKTRSMRNKPAAWRPKSPEPQHVISLGDLSAPKHKSEDFAHQQFALGPSATLSLIRLEIMTQSRYGWTLAAEKAAFEQSSSFWYTAGL